MPRLKICGLWRMLDIAAVNAVQPDYVGFVFADSRRRVNESRAPVLRDMLKPGIEAVGVFVNDNPEHIASLCGANTIDYIQLHGTEDGAYIARLRELTDKPIIKAVRVKSAEDILRAQELDCDYLLLDSPSPGKGSSFDWSLIPEMDKPYFLAGGLDLDNIRHAAVACEPFAFDVSTGVETQGLKDPVKIAAFTREVRRINKHV